MSIFTRLRPLWLVLGVGLAACVASPGPAAESNQPANAASSNKDAPAVPTPLSLTAASLPDKGPAPDFTNEVWLNSDRPLTLETLQGKVVLVEFWTFG